MSIGSLTSGLINSGFSLSTKLAVPAQCHQSLPELSTHKHLWIPTIWLYHDSIPETFNPEPFGLLFSLVWREVEWHGGPQKPREGGQTFPLERGQGVVLQTPEGECESPQPMQGRRPQGERGDPGRPHRQPSGAGQGQSPQADGQN